MPEIERPAKKSKIGAPRRDIRIVRPSPINPDLPPWRQLQLQAWSARRAIRVLRRLRRADPNIPAARIVELQLKAIELEVRIEALSRRFPPPTQPTPPTSDAPPPAREISPRDEIRRRPETRTGPPGNDDGPLDQRGPRPAHSADVVSNDAPTIDLAGPLGKRGVKRGLPPRELSKNLLFQRAQAAARAFISCLSPHAREAALARSPGFALHMLGEKA
jgi:hypothetical protein